MLRALRNDLARALYRAWPFRKARTRLYKALWKTVSGKHLHRDAGGALFLLDLDQFIECQCFMGGFEETEMALLERHARDLGATVFLDVGANFGLYSVRFGRARIFREIHAFEPDPRCFALLGGNLFLNDLWALVRTHPIALSDAEGEADFHVAEVREEIDWRKFNRGVGSLEFRGERHTTAIRVRTARLDDLLRFSGERIALKIDIEGHERAALLGMERLLRDNRAVLLVEAFPDNLASVRELLEGWGYRKVGDSLGDNHLFRND